MTRKHFEWIAWSFRKEAEYIDDNTANTEDAHFFKHAQWDRDVLAMADVLAGCNYRFDRGRFLVAAGFTHRPDGSMFPKVAPR
jgi:hypothetical protein